MPRRPRIRLADIPQHVVQRGVNRQPCFFAEEDYHCYLHWLAQAATRWGCCIHACVLMTNHVHLLVTPATTQALAKLMQSIGRRYVQYINRHYRRSGTLWEGRFKCSAIQAEQYLLACQRCKWSQACGCEAGPAAQASRRRGRNRRTDGLRILIGIGSCFAAIRS